MADTVNNTLEFDDSLNKWVEETWEFGISNDMLDILMLALSVILHGVISLAGVLSNSVNVLVFIRLGLKDSMSVGLWALSFTDLVVSTLQLAGSTTYLAAVIYPYSPIDLWTVSSVYIAWARYSGYFISCWITTIISLERCYCVVAPFRVKQVFTKTKCVVSIIIICVIHLGLLSPVYVYNHYEWELYPTGEKDENGTDIYFMQMQLSFTTESAEWEFINDIGQGVALSLTSQGLILICTFGMIYSLKASSRIRHHITTHKGDNLDNTDNLSPREKRLVKVVLLLATIQTTCNIPRFLATAVHHLLPGVHYGAYNNICTLMWEVAYIFGTICCAINICVYLTLNANFKYQFRLIFYKKL